MAVAPQPQKRKAATTLSEVNNVPSQAPPKRAKWSASSRSNEEKAWDDFVVSMEARVREAEEATPDTPYSPLFSADRDSVPETTMTSKSGSRRAKKLHCEVPGCGKAFDRQARLDIHMRSHTGERPYVCEEDGCGKTFLRNEHLKRHMDDKHSDERKYICSYITGTDDDRRDVLCGKSFTTATRLRRHAAAHEAKEETKCSEPGCGKVFRKQETLQRHIKLDHLGEKAFKCTNVEMAETGELVSCDFVFSNSKQLRNHVAREHSGLRYFCDICSPDAMDADHKGGLDEEMVDLMSLHAPVGFATYAELQHHLKTAHPPSCPECGKDCESNRALKAHIDIEHTVLSTRQTHMCTWPGCTRGFTKAGNLKVHMQNVHTKTRNFVCGEFDLTGNPKVEGWDGEGCGSAFGTKANLEDHVRTRHMGLKGKIRPSRLLKKEAKEMSSSQTPSTLDEAITPDPAVSMLTGYGYEQLRPVACLIQSCQQRFVREYDLAEHLELTHGWQVDDVNDRLAEKEAMESGRFWIGGGEQLTAINVADEEGPDDVMKVSAEVDMMDDERRAELERSVAELQALRRLSWEELEVPRNGFDPTEAADGQATTMMGVESMAVDPTLI
ncbi:hypothetical protein BAUCODRAFT_141066 [Baudoinia panamericana UAMH 10762]|uniref:C2H2-type domain-containing protein n=1 Tax=Baudoinia panamericana (strain UAMH 10762) TaxID=717646 RepID=M2ME94_BAUPA|nr:uncharacterized protein BAUCODRAFT_141066 [Baudoinia panamericana UAMH 10762]EMC94901.1 hypothetical protein BAUCODRAFT_141066 [Baudoinia panamericana UAMH 10762]